MNRMLILCTIYLASVTAGAQDPFNAIPVHGDWNFRLDPNNEGLTNQWQNDLFTETIPLPGSTNEHGVGTPPPDRQISFLSQHFEYVGPAWYQKKVIIPETWAGKRITLFLERCHWESQVWVDQKHIGMQDSLCVPHTYDVSAVMTPGERQLTLRIDNTVKYKVGMNAHSITEHTQTNWNGVIGRMELQATDPVWIDSVNVFPNLHEKNVVVRILVGNALGTLVNGRITATLGAATKTAYANLKERNGNSVEFTLPTDDSMKPWDEFSPALLELLTEVRATVKGNVLQDTKTMRFGLREISHQGTQFLINGRPTLVRGNLECCIFPQTGYPPMQTDEWLRRFRIAREYGINHVRFHSWCPPEAAFDAADQLGMMLHIETPVWTELGSDPKLDAFVYSESDRILETYGNHPSFCMLAVGNEPSGKNKDAFLQKIVAYWRQKDPRRLYTTCAGWPELPGSDYHVVHERDHKPYRLHGGPLGPTTAFDYSNTLTSADAPVIAHELGQWCVYPNYAEIPRYTGALRPRNLEIFRESLTANHMLDQADAFSKASGALQTLLYKADIEAVLRSQGTGGFQLLSLQDFPGQGSALVGFLDAYWENKGYCAPETFHEFCSETVPLLRLEKFVWTTEETFHASAEIAHFGPAPLISATVGWSITADNGAEIALGTWPAQDIPLGNGTALGEIELNLKKIQVPAKLTITIAVKDTPFLNHWDVWVYPPIAEHQKPENVVIVHEFDDTVGKILNDGGRVLLFPSYLPPRVGVKSAFESIFWNTQWFPGQRRQLGILCNPTHPILKLFPNDGHTGWQWWSLLNGSTIMNLDSLPSEVNPVVQVVDDWNKNRRLGAVFEANVGQGKLLVCSLGDIATPAKDPAEFWFIESLLNYVQSDMFNPAVMIDAQSIKKLFEKPPLSVLKVDSEARGYEGANAVDGDASTIWHTPWEGQVKGFPHEIQIELAQPATIQGLRLLPRQDVANGFISEYQVFVSGEGKKWGEAIAKGTLDRNASAKEIRFKTPQTAQYLRLVAISGFNNQPFIALAEVEPITE
ncbi:MAG TPA: discoidin domain-containing protein [Candidatus Hydrogenedentes bacterium]|nr:discoidin domain-containing protein [Candidatus Hydrogenedentota bacterium]